MKARCELQLVHGEQAKFTWGICECVAFEERAEIELRQRPLPERANAIVGEIIMIPIRCLRIVSRRHRAAIKTSKMNDRFGIGGAASDANHCCARLSVVDAKMPQRTMTFGADEELVLTEMGLDLQATASVMMQKGLFP